METVTRKSRMTTGAAECMLVPSVSPRLLVPRCGSAVVFRFPAWKG
jgi:hypothetical protein